MNGLVVGALVGAFFGAIAAELLDISAWVAPRMVRLAAKRLPTEELSQRYEEEWLAELHHYNGLKLIKLAKAASLLLNSFRVRAAYRTQSYVTSALYWANLRDVAPYLLRMVWHGENVGSPSLLLSYQLSRLLGDDVCDIEVEDQEDGSGIIRLTFHPERADASASARIVHAAVFKLIGLLATVHTFRSAETPRLGLAAALQRIRRIRSGQTVMEDASPILQKGIDAMMARNEGQAERRDR